MRALNQTEINVLHMIDYSGWLWTTREWLRRCLTFGVAGTPEEMERYGRTEENRLDDASASGRVGSPAREPLERGNTRDVSVDAEADQVRDR